MMLGSFKLGGSRPLKGMGKHSERSPSAFTQGRYSLTFVVWAFAVGITVGVFASSRWMPGGGRCLVSEVTMKGELNALLDAVKLDPTIVSPTGVDAPSLSSETGAPSVGNEDSAQDNVEAGDPSKEAGETTKLETTELETTELETAKLEAPSDPLPPCIDCDVTQLDEGPGYTLLGCPSLKYNLEPATLQLLSEKKGGPVWLSFIGDSLLRNPMVSVPRGIVGDGFMKERRVFNMSWYHREQAFCCGDIKDLETCTFVRLGLDTEEEKADRFVQSFFADKGKRSLCWSYRFVGALEPKIVVDLETYMKHPVPPTMLALNQGLHHVIYNLTLETHVAFWRGAVEMLASINGPREDKDKTTILIHAMTHLDDAINTRRAKMPFYNNSNVQLFNAGLDNLLLEIGWPALKRAGFRYVDNYGISLAKGIEPVGDGTHYKGSYQTILTTVQVNLVLLSEFDGFCELPKVHIDPKV